MVAVRQKVYQTRNFTSAFYEVLFITSSGVLMVMMSLYSDKIIPRCICQLCQGHRNDLNIISCNLCFEGAELFRKHT